MMGEGYLSTPAIFLIKVVFGLYATLVVLRFLLQLMRADFYNPVSQVIVRLTKPLLNPLRRVIPGVKGMDVASLVLAWLTLTIEQLAILGVAGTGFHRPLGEVGVHLTSTVHGDDRGVVGHFSEGERGDGDGVGRCEPDGERDV